MFNALDELFAPGRRHAEDERNRLELVRDEEGDADPGRGPVDLDSGAVLIRPPRAGGQAHRPAVRGSARLPGEQPQPVGERGRLAAARDAQLGEDVGDVHAGGLR
ncbi:DUF6191 domain-containing protein [Streptomyces sp. NPDC005722]